MRNLLKIIVINILLFSCGTTNKIENKIGIKQVYLFAGQSNMDGRANGEHLTNIDLQRLSKVANRISFYYNHKPVSPLQLTSPSKYIKNKFNLKESFGPELFFGIEMAEKYPNDEFIFIKRSKGGTSLYGCWNPEWSEEKAIVMNEVNQPKLYADFINYVKNILDQYNSKEYEIKGMLWVQGEADSGVKKYGLKPSETYGENLQKFIKYTRTDLRVPQMPFVIFQVGSGMVVKGMQETAKKDKNVYLIPSSKDKNSEHFYERNPPPIGHYTTISMKKIGVNFYKTFETINKK